MPHQMVKFPFQRTELRNFLCEKGNKMNQMPLKSSSPPPPKSSSRSTPGIGHYRAKIYGQCPISHALLICKITVANTSTGFCIIFVIFDSLIHHKRCTFSSYLATAAIKTLQTTSQTYSSTIKLIKQVDPSHRL